MAVSTSPSTGIKPIFVLRQVNVTTLIQRYKNGEFSQITKPAESKVEMAKSLTIKAPSYGKSLLEATCAIKDRMDKSIIFFTSNVRNFETYHEKGETPKGGRCEWCRREFTHDAQGVPVSYREDEMIRVNENGILTSSPYYVFWDEGTFCHDRCVLAHILQFKALGPQQRDPLYLNSEAALRFRFSLSCPDVELKPAHDYRLLKCNGGPLTNEEFDSDKYTYLRTSTVVIVPAKVAYIRQP